MTVLFDSLKKEISQLIVSGIEQIALETNKESTLSEKDVYKQLSVPPDFSLGQYAFPCFQFAKTLKIPPQKIAEILKQKIEASTLSFVASVENVNAYLNFHANFNTLASTLHSDIHSRSFFSQKLLEENEIEKIVVEYSQPNTHKAMHVGHLRGLVLGDAVSHLLSYAGHTVIKATYPGDVGTHVAKIIWYICEETKSTLPREQNTQGRANWLAHMYAKADEAYKASQKEEAKAIDIKQKISEILSQLNQNQGSYYEVWKETRQWSLDYLQGIYDWLHTPFDVWYFESECEKPSKELVKQKYKEGFFVQDQGAIGIDLSPWKLGFAMFLKSDGNGLYITKDLDLITKKFADPTVTKSIYVVDVRQKFHFQQLFKTAELMGYPQAAKSQHLSFETVNTEQGEPFSSRQMNGLGLLELKEKMESTVTNDYLARYKDTWSPADVQKTSEEVTIGALKYGLLRVDNNTQIHFSLKEWLKLDGDTGPYLQYVHARSCSILEKQGKGQFASLQLNEKEEKELAFLLWQFNEYALSAAKQCKPCVLSNYLFDVAKLFNRFYELCPIKSSQDDIKNTRLVLVEMTQQIIAKGLSLLGIHPLQKM